MTQLLTASDYVKIHSIVFQPDYPGYKPNVIESPNGDGKKDELKRYAHVADKYLTEYLHQPSATDKTWQTDCYHILSDYLDKAHQLSLEVAITLGVPRQFWPVRKYGALRILEYGPDAITNPHTDFDLFTLMCYRNDESCFKYIDQLDKDIDLRCNSKRSLKRAQQLNAQVHFGELLEAAVPTQFMANKHEVVSSAGPWQYSIVYFAVPDHAAVLPSGLTVGKWMEERKNRSRYDRG